MKELTCRYGPANASIKTVYQGIKEYLPNSEVRYAKGCDIIDKYFPESELYNVPLDTQEQAMIQEAVELSLSLYWVEMRKRFGKSFHVPILTSADGNNNYWKRFMQQVNLSF